MRRTYSQDAITPLISLAFTYEVLSYAQLTMIRFKMKNKSAKMLNNNGPSIKPSGTSKTISNQEL